MNRMRCALLLLVLVFSPVMSDFKAHAASQNLVISQLQAAGSATGTAGQEFVEVFNNSSQDINVTDWCVTYSSASDATTSTVGCLKAPDAQTKLWLRAGQYIMMTSPDYETATGIKGDMSFAYVGGIAATAGHARLLDAAKTEVDKLAWGTTAVHPETATIAAPVGGKSLQRKLVTGSTRLQDTDNNSSDFTVGTPIMHTSGLYEIVTVIDVCPNIVDAQAVIPDGLTIDGSGNCVIPPPVDVCPNISSLQIVLPSGYMHDALGDCYADICVNIDGLQSSLPVGTDVDGTGTCSLHDECVNLPGAQMVVPDGYRRYDDGSCALDVPVLRVTELLPNASGSDTGHEYVELYNPDNRPADLKYYKLYVGLNDEKSYAFPDKSVIEPGAYLTFSDQVMKFNLVNTASRVSLRGIDGSTMSRTDPYANPTDDTTWALVDGVWQFTNQPTPGSANLSSLIPEDDTENVATGLAACPAGKYRNPLTNRCRSIETDAVVLASCQSNEYRNPETNRCRKIAVLASTTPCKAGQYRSEDTGRCRSLTQTANATPCKAGQERNPATNRCRNATSSSMPKTTFGVTPVKDDPKVFMGWWTLAGIGAVAAGYAAWEWRREVSGLARRLIPVWHTK